MDDEEFQRLSTLYLEDDISDADCARLNRELASSADRVQQFNDLRLLAGLVHEHGRPAAESPAPLTFPQNSTPAASRIRWLAAAAILVVGFTLGSLSTALLRPGQTPATAPPQITAVQLVDGSFESPALATAAGYPAAPGLWSGEGTEVTGAKEQVKPYDGKAMLCFSMPPQPAAPPEPVPGTRWQVVELKDVPVTSPDANATLRTRFNHQGEPAPDTNRCIIELYAFDGPPATAGQRLVDGDFLSSTRRLHVTDADPETWETVETSLAVPPGTDFLLVGISGYGAQRSQPFGGESYVGHYADGAELHLEQPSQ